jgi:hypothetical protein
MYSKRAISTSRRVCQSRRQTSSAFSDLKKLSTADLAIVLEPMAQNGSIVTIPLAAHRNLEPVLSQQLLIVVSAVLRPAIRVMNAARWWPADGDGHVQSSQGQILLHAVADGPADNAPGEKVNDHGKINPTLPRPDVGDVASLLAGRRCLHRRKATSGSARSP